MSGKRHKRSHPRKSPPAGSEMSPIAVLYAEALVRMHGTGRAREIVRMNAPLDGDDQYWNSVLQAIGDSEDSFNPQRAVTPTGCASPAERRRRRECGRPNR
jgi:hypothetical protein